MQVGSDSSAGPRAGPALRCVGLKKRFGATEALKGVDIEVGRGEVVALVGENGAGKSTLVRMVNGEFPPDDGEVEIGGSALGEASPGAAAALGVAVIHQELSYVGTMSVAENLFLSRLPTRGGRLAILDRRRLHADARRALEQVGPHIDVRRRMSELRVGDVQLVEIARAVASGASLVLMDEPTAALNAEEVERLFEVVRSLRGHGVGVLYISHRLDELRRVADRVVVLRDGRRVAAHDVGAATREQLVAEIVGKELGEFLREGVEEHEAAGEVRLALRGVGVPGVLGPMTFEVRSDEILGLYGLAGSGVEHVAHAIFVGGGATGEVAVDGAPVRRRNPARCRKAGLALVPADRRNDGLFPVLSVATNIGITAHAAAGALSLVTRPRERAIASRWIEALDVRPPDPDLPISGLSGGNQQKAIIGRWLVTRPRAFVLDEPTRGVDVGAKSQIYHLISNLAAEGAAVVVVSSDLPELMSLCTHVGVISRGALVGIYPRARLSEQRVVDLAIGGHAA